MSHGSHIRREWPRERLRVVHLVMGLGMGGAERLLADALPIFQRDRYEMEILGLGRDGPMGAVLAKSGIKHTVFNGGYGRPQFVSELFLYLHSRRPEILTTHLYWPGVIGRMVGAIRKIPLIVSFEHIHADFFSATRSLIERPTWRWADAVVASCEAVLKSRESSLTADMPRFIVKYGIDCDEINPADYRAARERLGVPEGKIVAGWIGRMDDAQKDLTTLIRAAKILRDRNPNLIWVLVGDGPDRAMLERSARDAGLEKTIAWLGIRPDGRKLYPGMDIFVFPSRHEGMPIAVLEASAAGVPVVASNVAGIPEIVVDGKSGLLFPQGNVNALVEAIQRLISEPETRKSMGIAARKRMEEHFSIQRFVDEMDGVYRKLWRGVQD